MTFSFRTNPVSLVVGAIIWLVLLTISAMKLFAIPAGRELVLFVGALSVLLLITGAVALEFRLERLQQQIEPKTGTVSYAYAGDGAGAASKSNAREELTHSLAITLAPYLAIQMTNTKFGAYIRGAVDEILGVGTGRTADALDVAKAGTAVHSQLAASAYNLMKASGFNPGEKADQLAEAEIVGKGLTAPRVTAEQIQVLMDKLTWRFEQPEGTTSTFAHAFLDRFYLATGHSACVSPENFDAAMGMKYARDQAEGKARDKLWELEGYALFQRLKATAA